MDAVQAEMHFTEFAIQIGRNSLTNLYGNPWNSTFDLHIDTWIRMRRFGHEIVQRLRVKLFYQLSICSNFKCVSYSWLLFFANKYLPAKICGGGTLFRYAPFFITVACIQNANSGAAPPLKKKKRIINCLYKPPQRPRKPQKVINQVYIA